MPVEVATHISDLVPANPLTTDATNQGDDHIRLIKAVLQATLPGTGSLAGALVPVGGIILWSGSVASIPANWQLCNGTNGTPDLRDKFVVGAGSTYAVDATGGSLTTDSQGAHNHGAGTGLSILDVTELPADGNTLGTTVTGGSVLVKNRTDTPTVVGHSHNITSDGAHTHTATPPYLALAYIQRIT